MNPDGRWGSALTCKPPPDLPRLPHPRIIISLNGLTLRLVDESVGFEKVFAVGVGAHDNDEESATFGESLSYYPLMEYGTNDFGITPRTTTACKIWWTDPDSGERLPVFAGLPYLGWSGSYAIHGPIDNFRASNGGALRRGYVSHGCIRMEAADVLELYARIRGVPWVPVHVQREPERTAEGSRVDVSARWIGAECASDGDCGYANGFCKMNPWSQRGFCSARCSSYCADRAGYPTTFCVADPDAPGQGMCVPRVSSMNADCRPYDHMVPAWRRRNASTTTANVCVPGSPGWVGDHCLADTDCKNGTSCVSGVCSMSCQLYCADQPGTADTFCVNDDSLGGAGCVRQCTPSLNAPECAQGTECVPMARNGQTSPVRYVCLPSTY